jgi:hypothetical protein
VYFQRIGNPFPILLIGECPTSPPARPLLPRLEIPEIVSTVRQTAAKLQITFEVKAQPDEQAGHIQGQARIQEKLGCTL